MGNTHWSPSRTARRRHRNRFALENGTRSDQQMTKKTYDWQTVDHSPLDLFGCKRVQIFQTGMTVVAQRRWHVILSVSESAARR